MNFASGRNVAPAILHPNRSASVQEEFTMTKLRASFCTAALLGACLAQTSNSPQAAAPPGTSAPTAAPANQLPAGTIIPAELAKSIDAKKAKSGDHVVAKTTIDLRSRDGSTVIPKGAKVLGHVTDAKARSKDEMKGGRDLQFNGGIQAIGKPEQNAAAHTGGGSPMSESGGVPSGAAAQGGMGGARTGGAMGAPPSAGNPGNGPTDNGVPATGGVGPLSPASQGVVGIQGLSLQDSAQASVITSSSGNVHLDSGTQLILRAK